MGFLNHLLQQINQILWGPILVPLLIGTGLLLTWRLRAIQLRHFILGWRLLFTRDRGKGGGGDISPFQSLTTTLSATIGTGNIAGVATALTLGGAGALFWMWVSGFVGMALKYSEASLGVHFRIQTDRGEMAGGPMYVLSRGMGVKSLAIAFAFFGILASLGIGNVVQSHSIADGIHALFSLPYWVTGLVLAILVALTILGGIHAIGRVTSILVPGMALLYLIGSCVVIFLHIGEIPALFALVIRSAFTGQAALGGFAGATAIMALRVGMARGIFSNEAGLGSAGIAAAAARTSHPGRQALIVMLDPFLDTLVVCTLTGFVLLLTQSMGVMEDGVVLTGAPLVMRAFSQTFAGGEWVVAMGLILFAGSTILGWAYYGERCLEYLLGSSSRLPYRIAFVIIVFLGALAPLDVVWNFADVANGLMALPNLIGLLVFSGLVTRLMRDYQGIEARRVR